VSFLGDVYFGEYYQNRIARKGGQHLLNTKGYDHSFERISQLIAKSDKIIANLESPITDLTHSPFLGKKKYLHFSDTRRTPETLLKHKINNLSLSNNHMLDYGVKGLDQTLRQLSDNGLYGFGAGMSDEVSARPLCFSVGSGNVRCSIIVATGFEYLPKYDREYAFYSGLNKAGVNSWSAETSQQQIRDLRTSNSNAFIVAYPHWGKNYAWKSMHQARMAHALIDAGADIVIGHGAHALQEIDKYNGKWILYNLGNFVFNSPGRYALKGHINTSLIARVAFSIKDGVFVSSLKLYPIMSDNLLSGYQPWPLSNSEIVSLKERLVAQNNTAINIVDELSIEADEFGCCFGLRP
jgi:poly-gamma-glutamate capsule biosynthesis protein CapA/YwtB (metallophosphatase superfamily)